MAGIRAKGVLLVRMHLPTVYFGGILTFCPSQACDKSCQPNDSMQDLIFLEKTYQSFEDSLAGGGAAGLDLPNVVPGHFVKLESS